MRNILIQDDVALVESRLKQFESNTGCELLLVITNASDPYPGASSRFGLVGGFVLSFIFKKVIGGGMVICPILRTAVFIGF